MKLEFIIYEINGDSILWKTIKGDNEFILIEEEEKFYKVLQVNNEILKLTPGLRLNQIAYTVEKNMVKKKEDKMGRNLYVEFDIPKPFLTVEIINNIRTLN